MGGGGKRGRTQRRHFKQSRENVWKHNSKRTRPDDVLPPGDPNTTNLNPNSSWEPFANQNPGFEEYYKEQGIVPEEEWDEFICMLRKPLPAAFRINSSGQFFQDIRSQLENDFMKSLEAENNNEYEREAIRPLPWYPDKLAWHLNFSRMQLRKNQTLERFHEFLKHENEVGNITRQEAVSMVPPLFLDVLPDHHVLDMCAAPGSKTFQLLEIIHQSTHPGSLPNGLVVANDVDVQRCNLLIHQTKRMCSANLIVTNHEAQHFPSCSLARDHLENSKGEQKEMRKNTLQFDRVLCDVPCSGDGTLRKAPDLWRKWNAGMGNGVHRLQVEIAMRGIALLKVGGRLVYSTCSMNPVENEAVVAEVLRRSGGSIELLDVSSELPELLRRPGLKTWKVRDKGLWLGCYEHVPIYRRSLIIPSMFPSGQSCKGTPIICDGVQDDIMTNGSEIVEEKIDAIGEDKIGVMRLGHQDVTTSEQKNNAVMLENNVNLADINKVPCEMEEVSNKSAIVENLVADVKMEVSTFPLERCMRILPHDQNCGAFFIAVFQKLSHIQVVPENYTSRSTNSMPKFPANKNENLEVKEKSEIKPSEDISCQDNHIAAEPAPDASLINKQSSGMPTEVGMPSYSKDVCSKDDDREVVKACDIGENGHVGREGAKGKSQIQGKWRGVDPVVFFRDETTISSIRSFYGVSESFPLDGHLVARNNDTDHVKRIYYISKSVHDILQLNFQVGQRLKITSLGLKTFERQASKDHSSPCAFRLSSEGLPLLLPYISKQKLYATITDFQHLLQYRVIKFSDFVDADLGDKASKLMSGCCIVVLNEGNETIDTIPVAASTIAIVCWKGKTNLSIMVSQLDAKELLERLSVRYGGERGALPAKDENTSTENDGMEDLKDAELMQDFEEPDQEAI